MRRRAIAWVLALVLVGAARATSGDAADVVSILMEGTFFSEPATVRFLVAVEPNEENRFLWVEADSGDLYRASEVTLNGAGEKRLHAFVFKGLTGGRYLLRAQVRSRSAVRGLATRSIVVMGKESPGRTGAHRPARTIVISCLPCIALPDGATENGAPFADHVASRGGSIIAQDVAGRW